MEETTFQNGYLSSFILKHQCMAHGKRARGNVSDGATIHPGFVVEERRVSDSAVVEQSGESDATSCILCSVVMDGQFVKGQAHRDVSRDQHGAT